MLVGAELMTGTFYLLAVGIAFALGGVAAWLGAGVPLQFAVAGVLGVVLTIIAHRWRLRARRRRRSRRSTSASRCSVRGWNADGTARVAYRGTHGMPSSRRPTRRAPRRMYIVATRGSTLVLVGPPPCAP